nr:DUF3868 domain-containing protein [Parabacteroides acidifaciens]
MNKKTISNILIGLVAVSSLNAQSPVTVERQSVQRSGSDLVINMRVDISNMELGRNRTVVCTPLLQKGDSLMALPPVIVNGRVRQIAYERRNGAVLVQPGEVVVRRKNKTEQKVDYLMKVPYRTWMNRADVSMVTDLCGCGWETLQNDKSHLFAINLEAPEMKPVPVFMAPAAEEVKKRALNGQAYLDFPVNSTVIRPDYRKNPSELAAIRSTIEAVKENKNATITHISIKGFASPEGTYANNGRLAKGRAEALLDYVKELYDLSGIRCDVTSEPEDWEGLETRLSASNLEGKEDALAIIRADEPADPDAREWKLKQLPVYKQLLNEIYPALRHSDYVVEYNIRNFTVEEARDIIYRDPSQLSLEEMHRVALTYPAGSDEFKEVFEIAVRMYPDDPVSNLNAANIALQNKQADKARRYLVKATPSPEKELAEAIVLMLEEKWPEAEAALNRLTDKPKVAEAVAANLKIVKQMQE